MHNIHNIIGVPKIVQKDGGDNTSTFTIGPLPKGLGNTLGNSLRRTALSLIPGTKVTGVKAKVNHEYSTLPGVKDSMINIILNLKDLVLEKQDIGIEWLKLSKNTAGKVLASDIQSGGITILNPNLYITEIDKDGFDLDIEIRVEKGTGYLTSEALKMREDDVEVLLVDTNFSPVLNVRYNVTTTRHGDIDNLDSLEIAISTNGGISPVDALKFSGSMLTSYFSIFNEDALQIEGQFIANMKDLLIKEKEEIQEELEKESYTPIEIMGLSPRTLNALINGEILSIERLTKCTETKLSSIKGFGKKAMTEIRDALKEKDLKLLGDD